MKFTGTSRMQAAPEAVYAAFNDPAVLARTVPGCGQLTEIAPDHYSMILTAGVAAVRGTYAGEVQLVDGAPPSAFTLRAKGSGGPGTVSADIAMRLAPADDGGTNLSYDADAVIGGTIGGVGQRMLNGVAKKMAAQFFEAVDADIASGGAVAVAAPADRVAEQAAGAPGRPRVFPGRSATATANLNLNGGAGFAVGALIGGVLALAGVVIGARIGRRR